LGQAIRGVWLPFFGEKKGPKVLGLAEEVFLCGFLILYIFFSFFKWLY